MNKPIEEIENWFSDELEEKMTELFFEFRKKHSPGIQYPYLYEQAKDDYKNITNPIVQERLKFFNSLPEEFRIDIFQLQAEYYKMLNQKKENIIKQHKIILEEKILNKIDKIYLSVASLDIEDKSGESLIKDKIRELYQHDVSKLVDKIFNPPSKTIVENERTKEYPIYTEGELKHDLQAYRISMNQHNFKLAELHERRILREFENLKQKIAENIIKDGGKG